MIKIQDHIATLLFDHDCVILPGIGGFITNYRSSFFKDDALFPPSKSIHFNRKLSHDDGLLVSSVASAHDISYEAARAIIDAFAQNIMTTLQSGKDFHLGQVGNLRMTDEERIVFEPDESVNYYNNSFGLLPVRAVLMNKGLERAQNFKDRKGYVTSGSRNKAVRVTLLTSLPIIAFLLWGIIDPVSVNSIYKNNLSKTTVFPIHKMVWYANDSKKDAAASNNPETIIYPGLEVSGKSGLATVKENLSFHVKINPDPVSDGKKAESTYHYIIGGAFRDLKNAEEYMLQLTTKGFNPEILPETEMGALHKVSYFKSTERKEIIEKLKAIRSEENPDAWLYTRKTGS